METIIPDARANGRTAKRRSAPSESWQVDKGRNSKASGRQSGNRRCLGESARSRGLTRLAATKKFRSGIKTDCRAQEAIETIARSGRDSKWIFDRPLDIGAGVRIDQKGI